MLRQSSSRNHRSKKLRNTRHGFHAFLLFAVGVWIVYQLTRSYGKRRAAVVATGGGEEEARRRMGRKGLVVGFPGRASSSDDDVVVAMFGSGDDVGSQGAASSDDLLSKTEEGGDGDEVEQVADEDDGGDDDAEDAVAGEGEDDDGDLLSRSDNVEEELKIAFGESDRATLFGNGDDGDHGTRLHIQKELNSSAVVRAEAAGSDQDTTSASQQKNVTDGAADGSISATDPSDSTLKNAPSMNQSLHDRATVGDAAEKLVVNGSTSTRVEQRMESTMSHSRG